MGGPDESNTLLEDAAASGGSPATVAALGWYGNRTDYLLGRLRGANPATKAAAALALFGLTGIELTDDEPAPTFAPEEGPFEAKYPEVDPPTELSAEPDAWSALLARHRTKSAPHTRYRFGRPWVAEASLRELEHDLTTPEVREWAHLELVARTGTRAPLDRGAFVARQRRELAAMRAALAGSLQRIPGAWPTQAAR